MDDEKAMREEFQNFNKKDEVWDVDADDENQLRVELLGELEKGDTEYNIKHFEEVLNKELAVFHDSKYDYVKDIKDAYKNSLSTTSEAKIFGTIPDHVFWDIKKPQQPGALVRLNRYNPFRGREFNNFFDMRDSETYIDS